MVLSVAPAHDAGAALKLSEIGFSQKMCFPAFAPATIRSACVSVGDKWLPQWPFRSRELQRTANSVLAVSAEGSTPTTANERFGKPQRRRQEMTCWASTRGILREQPS